jgi:hypothetical protein
MNPIFPALALAAEHPQLLVPTLPQIVLPTERELREFELGILPYPTPLLTISGSAPYNETGTLGSTTGSGTSYNASANEKGVVQITVPTGGVWAKRLQVAVNTTNGLSTSIMKPVIFSGSPVASSVLVMNGLPLTMPNITTLTIVDLWFNSGHTAQFFAAGTYFIGYHNGANGANINLKAASATTTNYNSDTYSDGTASPFGTASSSGASVADFAMPYSLTGP